MTNAHEASAAANESAVSELMPIVVQDWTLFASRHGEHWIKDLDLAERAEKRPARDIRKIIKAAVKEGAIMSALSERGVHTPRFRMVREIVTKGKGASEEVDTYYLNQAGALAILFRLRTAKAHEVTGMVISVFLAIARGEFVRNNVDRVWGRVADLELALQVEKDHRRAVEAKVALLDPNSNGLIGTRSRYILDQLRRAATLDCEAGGRNTPGAMTSRQKELDKELRQHVGFVEAIGWGWASLELAKFGTASAKLASMVARAEKVRNKAHGPRPTQMDLAIRAPRPGLVRLPVPKTSEASTKGSPRLKPTITTK